ncbi:MAG: hypothetical protein IKI31_05590, partial [Treponema sp.]|nr:hypothetical protein [Treponema sp.]
TDITQIVVQYISLSSINADVGANIFNSYTSTFKKNVLSHTELAIRGEDYIHIASTHRSGQSRMIFQTLFEKSKFTPIEQAELFINLVKNASSNISEEEIKSTQNEITSAYNSLFSNSTSFMEKLSELWAVESFYANERAESLLQKLISRPKEINSFNLENFRNNITQEEPFIFLLLNSAIYQKYEKKIKEKGYELITQKNSSWYLQELYKNAKNTIQEKKEAKVNTNSAKEYIEENKKQFSFFNLQNNIPCILKLNENSSTALTMISIEGGKLSTNANPGFFSVLINALVGNIQKELNEKKMNGLLEGFPSVKANTSLTSGIISVESLASDTEQIISCITNAIIFGEIKASHADGLVYNERTKKRLYDGDLTNQLYSKAIDELYKGSAYPAIFDTDKDILVHTKYTDILSSYPVLLNAARYKIILTGNFQKEKIVKTLSSTFGLLANQNETYSSAKIAKPNFPKDKRLSVKLRHVFLTDVSKEDAGPRPLVLIPTKNFSDPVQYWIPSPEPSSNDFTIFNSI